MKNLINPNNTAKMPSLRLITTLPDLIESEKYHEIFSQILLINDVEQQRKLILLAQRLAFSKFQTNFPKHYKFMFRLLQIYYVLYHQHLWLNLKIELTNTLLSIPLKATRPPSNLINFDITELPLGYIPEDPCYYCLRAYRQDTVCSLIMTCGHFFHPECLNYYLSLSQQCPICNTPLVGQIQQ